MQRFPHGATMRPPFVRPGAGYGRRVGRPGPESARPLPVCSTRRVGAGSGPRMSETPRSRDADAPEVPLTPDASATTPRSWSRSSARSPSSRGRCGGAPAARNAGATAVQRTRGSSSRRCSPGLFASGFSVTILAVSIPEIADDLGSSTSVLTFAVTGPFLALALAMPLLGKLGDVRGHRRVVSPRSQRLRRRDRVHCARVERAVAHRVARRRRRSSARPPAPASMAMIMHAFAPGAAGQGDGVVVARLGRRAGDGARRRRAARRRDRLAWDLHRAGAARRDGRRRRLLRAARDGTRTTRTAIDWRGAGTPRRRHGVRSRCAPARRTGRLDGAVAPRSRCDRGGRGASRSCSRSASRPRHSSRSNSCAAGTSARRSRHRRSRTSATWAGTSCTPLLVQEIFGFSVGQTSFAMAVRPLTFSITAPIAGYVAVRVGERRCALTGTDVARALDARIRVRVAAGVARVDVREPGDRRACRRACRCRRS